MKKILLSSVAFLGLATGAMAADLPSRMAPAPAPMIAAVPVFTWTGFYVGVNAGYGWNNNDNNSTLLVPGVGLVDLNNGGDDGGFVGGGQIGYNYQIGSFVVGLEADLQWADVGGNNDDVFVPGVGFVNTGNRNTDWFGTVRARAGFAFDRVLIYATGGFAFADDNNSNNCVVGAFVVACGNGGDSTGWTVGGGVEWALPTNWFASSAVTFGVEGLYVNLGSNDRADIVVNNLVLSGNSGDNEFGVVRAKLNFKF
jgi:outer membrane immunogenic protein